MQEPSSAAISARSGLHRGSKKPWASLEAKKAPWHYRPSTPLTLKVGDDEDNAAETQELPLPGNYKIGNAVWAAYDLSSDTELLVRKHCPGIVLGRSKKCHRVLVQFAQSAHGVCRYECDVLVPQIVTVEPPLPGNYTVGESVWASFDLQCRGIKSCSECGRSLPPQARFCLSCDALAVGEISHVIVHAHTHGKVLGRSSSEPSECVLVEFDMSADGMRSCCFHVVPERQVTSYLPGNYKVGNAVWAAHDLSNDTKLLVRKHCPGIVLDRSKSDPTERVLVQFDQSADSVPSFETNVTPSMILSREPPLAGNYKVGESVWSTHDLNTSGDAPRLIVREHSRGRVLGRSSWQPSSRVLVEFDTGTRTNVLPEYHVTIESPFARLGVMTLYHMTTEASAESIIRFGFCCSSGGMFGPFIYFARTPSECLGKANSSGAVLCARVDLGTALVCKTARTGLTAEKLNELGCQSVMGTAPGVTRDEFAVPSSSQISNIRLAGYTGEDHVQPWWAWPPWVHQLGIQIGFDDDEIEHSAAVSQGPRINSAGRPIHNNGRFMSYAEARKLGWSDTSVKEKMYVQCRSQNAAGPPTFFKGGQFIPGGGRAPAGGCYHSHSGDSLRESTNTFYKGGQFLPGGGRAPKGGCVASSGRCYLDYSIGGGGCSSGGGGTFYKGGQFIPGGGRAPKGGCMVGRDSDSSDD